MTTIPIRFDSCHSALKIDVHRLTLANLVAMKKAGMKCAVLTAISAFEDKPRINGSIPKQRWVWAVKKVLKHLSVNYFRKRLAYLPLDSLNSGHVIWREHTLSIVKPLKRSEERAARIQQIKNDAIMHMNTFKAWDYSAVKDDVVHRRQSVLPTLVTRRCSTLAVLDSLSSSSVSSQVSYLSRRHSSTTSTRTASSVALRSKSFDRVDRNFRSDRNDRSENVTLENPRKSVSSLRPFASVNVVRL